MFVKIHYCDCQGQNQAQTANRPGDDRKTIRKHANQDVRSFESRYSRQWSILGPYKSNLQYRLSRFPELPSSRRCPEISIRSCAGNDHNKAHPIIKIQSLETIRIRPPLLSMQDLVHTASNNLLVSIFPAKHVVGWCCNHRCISIRRESSTMDLTWALKVFFFMAHFLGTITSYATEKCVHILY